MTGHSGAGKSTLAALLGERGWPLLGDEFALLSQGRRAPPVPARDQLKNEAVYLFDVEEERARAGARRHAEGPHAPPPPGAEAIARMAETARPALILFPATAATSRRRSAGSAPPKYSCG